MRKKTKNLEAIELSAPWYLYSGIIENLFKNDKEVEITYDEEEEDGIFNIYIASANSIKLNAIKKIIGESKELGNITVVYNYKDLSKGIFTVEDFEAAFKDTGYYVCYAHKSDPMFGDFDTSIVAKEVLQFYMDNTADFYGNINLTVADAIEAIINNKPANYLITTANGTEGNNNKKKK